MGVRPLKSGTDLASPDSIDTNERGQRHRGECPLFRVSTKAGSLTLNAGKVCNALNRE